MADNQDNVDVEGDALAPPEPDGDAVDTGDVAPPHEELAPPDSQAEELAPPDSQAEELAPPEATPDELAPPEVQADELDAPETQTDELQPPDTQTDEVQMPDVAVDELPDDEMGGYEQAILDAEPTDTSVEDAIEERMPEPIEKDFAPKLLAGDGVLWCPSMNFVSSNWGATANQYYDMKGVVLGWPASPYDPVGMGDSGGIMVRHAGILRGITLTFYSSGDSSKLTFTVVRYTGGGAGALTSAPVSAASVSAGGYVRLAINTTAGAAVVAQGDILFIQVKTSDTISATNWYVTAFVTLDIEIEE